MVRKPEAAGRRPPRGLFGRLLDSLPNVFTLVLDETRRIVYANASFLEHFGLEWPAISGRVCFDLGSPFQTTSGNEMGFCPLDLGAYFPAHYILTREVDGQKFIYEGTFFHLEGGEEEAWTVCSFRDVTQMFNLECQVRQMDELERTLVQASMDGIVVNDLLGNVLIFNEGASRILGYRPEEVIGVFKVDVFYPEGLAHEIKELIYSPAYGGPGVLENYETLVRTKDGTSVPVWLSARLLRESGREVGIIGSFRDLRERKRLEEELVRQERLATLGMMVSHISHEIKNPLASIGGFAQKLARQKDFPEKARQNLELICQEVHRLEKFLADLSTFSRPTPSQKVSGDILALIRQVIGLMEAGFQEQGVTLELSAPEAIPAFAFDPGQIRQVLINLFKNSLEAMPHGGVLRVSTAVQEDRLVLTIADTGLGIDPGHLRSLFTPFFSTKEGGTGLGLTICRGLIDLHRGEIAIHSEVNCGTTCTVRLPLVSS
jgi:PAS domain S-box-containing protein